MKIAILGASGRLGNLFIKEGLKNKLDLTAIVRNDSKLETKEGINLIVKDLMSLTKEDLQSFDIVISALGIWEVDKIEGYVNVHKHVLDLLANTNIRYIVVGGVGSLYVDKEHSHRLVEDASFPQEWVPVATGNSLAYDAITSRNDVLWTFFSPAYNFDENGSEAQEFIFGYDEVLYNKDNESYLSYIDGVKIVFDEIKNKNYIQKRFTAIKK